jgi:ribosome maturation factor RimP
MAVRLEAIRLDAIRRAAERVAASHGLDVVDMEFAAGARERILRIFLEKNAAERARLKAAPASGAGEQPDRLTEGPAGSEGGFSTAGRLGSDQLSGVTHEDCAAFSRDFGVLLDVEDLVPDAAYTLEASSPGLDRKLSKPEDFRRFVGCLVKVRTFEPVRNNRHWQGRLTAADGNAIALDLSDTRQSRRDRRSGASGGRGGNDRSSPPGRRNREVSTVEIAFGNIEKANLVPEI